METSQNNSVLPPVFAGNEFFEYLGAVVTELGPDGGRAHVPVQPKLLQPVGIVHGGVYCSLIEGIASSSAYMWLTENGGGHAVGVNNNTDFLRPMTSGTMHVLCTPIHRGRKQQLWLATISDERDRLVARGQVRLQNIQPG